MLYMDINCLNSIFSSLVPKKKKKKVYSQSQAGVYLCGVHFTTLPFKLTRMCVDVISELYIIYNEIMIHFPTHYFSDLFSQIINIYKILTKKFPNNIFCVVYHAPH